MAKPGGFPDRPLTMIVPYGPGGGSGQVAAGMAKRLPNLPVLTSTVTTSLVDLEQLA